MKNFEKTMVAEQIQLLAESGWNRCDSIREGLEIVKLPIPDKNYLNKKISGQEWKRAMLSLEALREQFKGARFAAETNFGILLVPNPKKLDTRGKISAAMRSNQSREQLTDFVDDRLPAGKIVTRPEKDWTLFATVTGIAGIFCGSYDDIIKQKTSAYKVLGVDTRKYMVRQIWGARILQLGTNLPDSTIQKNWTFTLFPGEGLVDYNAVSGTILHDKVRFRLGRTDRRLSSARVCPAVVV